MFGKYPTQPVSKIVCTCSIFQGFFQVIEKPTMENHTWDLCSLVFTFPSISSKPKASYFFLLAVVLFNMNQRDVYFTLLFFWVSPNLSIPGGVCTKRKLVNPTWRIIPVSKCLVTPICNPFRPFGRTTLLGVTI